MRKLYGWQFFEALAKNNPQIGRSINDTVTMLNAGERVIAGTGPVGTLMWSAQKGNPLAMILPERRLGADHRGVRRDEGRETSEWGAAVHGISAEPLEASKVWVDHFNESMRPEVSPCRGPRRRVR